MEHSISTPLFDPDAQAALHAELAAAASTPALRPLVLHPEPDLGPRFVGYWRQLSALPRRTRRSLQRRWKRSLAAIALLMALGQVPALAATIAVDGSTCNLVDAITAANTDAPAGGCTAGNGADTLVLAAGSTHTLTTVAYGFVETATGLPLVTSSITIAGNGSTVERGAGAPEMRLMAVDGTGNLALHNLTLMGGLLPTVNPYGYEARGDPIVTSGGGVLNRGTLTLAHSTVSGNRSTYGGGLFNIGTLTLTNSTVSGNSGALIGGGVSSSGTLTLTNSTVSGNSGAFIGGGVSSSGALTLTNSTISGNRAIGGGRISYRRTARGGGVDNAGTLTLTNSTVSGNGVDSFYATGGGVRNDGTLTLTNSTVSGNLVSGTLISGGGVQNGDFGTLTLTNSTVSGNRVITYSYGGSASGGGVLNAGTLALSHTLISGNTTDHPFVDSPSPSEVVFSQSGSVAPNDFNLFGTNGDPGVSGFTPGPTDIIPSGPLSSILGPLADNGGPTQTHALVAGSPAVDAVTRGCPPPFTDQRGFARPADGDGDGGAECDVGAFELAAQPLPNCETAQPTRGCTVNGVAKRLCQGTARSDQIFGTHRGDIIFGLGGNDRINGLGGNDLICGGKGNDILRGKQGRDRVFGGPGDDNLQGGSANDQLSGEGGKDWLFGDHGDDALDGGAEPDKCQGGANGPTGDTAINCETVFGVP